jgi:DNA polymerase-3 subunit epsilon
MHYLDRPLAITDVETTGTDERIHEIIEIGLVLVDQKTLEIIEEWETKIKPMNIQSATEVALKINGYNEKEWENAPSIIEALETYSAKTRDTMFCAHNNIFDWNFLTASHRRTHVPQNECKHKVDLLTLGWEKVRNYPEIQKLGLKEICLFLGIEPEPDPHRALNGARKEYEVLRKLIEPLSASKAMKKEDFAH